MIVHFLVLLVYAGIIGGFASLLPEFGGANPRVVGDLAIVTLVVVCAGHLLAVLALRQKRVERAFAAMHAAQIEIRGELQGARDAATAIHDAIAAAAETRRGEQTSIGEVMAEVQVLQSLVGKLSDRGPPLAGLHARIEPASISETAPDLVAQRRSLRGLGEPEVLDIVRQGLREGRVDLYVQPVVSLPQRKHRFYECFSRIRAADGGIVGPDQYLGGAEREGLIGAIDNMLLFRCVQLVRRIHKVNRDISIFVNISEHSLADQRFFRDFAAFVADNRELAPFLVFEFAQSHVVRHGAAVMLELERLSRLGFRFSMDQITNLDLDVDALAQRHVRFIKIDAARLLHASRAAEPRLDLHRFKRALVRNQIDLIVERIETEQTLVELLDYPIDFGQGFLFGEPKIAKAA